MLKERTRKIKDQLDKLTDYTSRRTYYVMAKTAVGYEEFCRDHENYLDGKSKVYNTISDAKANCTSFDRIIVAPGDYDEGAVINITEEGLKILGPGISNQNVAMILGDSATHILMTVNAHNVEIAGLGFTQTKARTAITLSTTASYYKCHIHDCRFDGWGTATYGVKTDGTDGTYDSPDVVIEDCVFRSFATAAIYSNATRGLYQHNSIWTAAGTIGINHIPTTSNRPGTKIFENDIQGVNSTDTGIKLTGTPDAGAVSILRNNVLGCATTITQAANNAYNSADNRTGSADGGALIDTVA